MRKSPRKDFIDGVTAELRVGREGWQSIRPCVRRYVLPDGSEFFDWQEILQVIHRFARVEPPQRRTVEKRAVPGATQRRPTA